MKSVSAAFKTAWAQKYGRKEILKVLYKRRYWNGAAFVYEADWTTLDQNVIPPVRKINWKLDTQNLNEMLASNVTLSFDDRDRKWLPTGAIFQADGTATTGYIPLKMKFQVQFGYILADGTKEYTALFTGLAEDYRFDGGDPTVEITVSGNERLLKDADAENVMTAFTSETCTPAADGTIAEFFSVSVGVGRITTVVVDGVTKTEGTHYTLSGLNSVGKAAITFKSTSIPANTKTPVITGEKWKADQKIETLVELLCDEAGIGAGDRTINAVLFPGGTSSSKTLDTAAEWQAGDTVAGVDTETSSGFLTPRWTRVDDFADGDFIAAPVWTGTATGWSISSGKLAASTPTTRLYTVVVANASGTWQVKMDRSSGNADFSFMGGALTGIFIIPPNKYRYWIRIDGATLYLYRGDSASSSVTSPIDTLLTSAAYSSAAGDVYRVTRASDGEMKVYVNAVLKLTYTDATYTVATSIQVNATGNATFDDIYYSNLVDATTPVTEALVFIKKFDLLATPIAWGVFSKTEVAGSGWTTAYATDVSSDDSTYDGYVSISGTTIGSALKRYVRIKITFTQETPGGTASMPTVDVVVMNFSTSAIFLAIANFSSKTCYSAIQRLAQIADYEWGFDGAGLFFFRSKTVSGAAVISLTQENAISKLSDWRSGYDRIINRGRVRYGNAIGEVYVKEYGSSDAGEASPTSEQSYGTRLREENIADILLANDADLGTARARLLHDNNYLPKRRFQASCRGIPHLDLADIAAITYADRPRDINPMLGDPAQPWGDSALGPSTLLLANGLNMKVMGISFSFPTGDGDGVKSDLELVEVL